MVEVEIFFRVEVVAVDVEVAVVAVVWAVW